MFHVDRRVRGLSGGGGSEWGRSTAVGTVNPSSIAGQEEEGMARVLIYSPYSSASNVT
jgi:hypothetical protein